VNLGTGATAFSTSIDNEFASLLVPNTASPQFCDSNHLQCAIKRWLSGERSLSNGVTTGVANGDRARVEGIFSWQSYGQAILAGREPELIDHCISQNFAEVNEERSLFDAVREVIRHGVVVVRSRDNKLCGLVTQRDVAAVFVDLAEPFLFLGQIENHLRELVERMRLSRDQLQSLADDRDSERAENAACVDDLTLGELIRAIQSPQSWDRLGFKHDRAILLNRLERVRKIRNRVMHFDADGISSEDKTYLKETRRILQEL
jgi:hypothetical protein